MPGKATCSRPRHDGSFNTASSNRHRRVRKVSPAKASDQSSGNIVRQGPNSLAFFTHSANAEIYGVRSNVSKTDGYATMSPSSQPNLISAVDKNVHAWKRRVISQAMSDTFLKEMQPRVVSHIRGFLSMLGSEADVPEGKPVLEGWAPAKNLGVVCDWLTFDVISDLIYGKAVGMLHSPELRWLPGTFQRISQRSATCLMQPSLFRYKVDRLLLMPRRKLFRQMSSWLSKLANERADLGKDTGNKNLFNFMMNTVDSKTGKQFSRKDMWTESVLIFGGSSDTTSSTMAAVFFYLLHNPSWLASATAEVRATFSSEEDILPGASLSSCELLAKCITETMRLSPTAPNGPPRHVDDGGVTIDGNFLPQGTIVSSPIYRLQRDGSFFDYPNDFQPDRWIVNESRGYPEQRIERQQKAFFPFHVRPWLCVGWRLAKM